MSPSNRRYTYRGKIKISREDMVLLRAGRKKCTVRMGTASVATPEILMTDGRTSVAVRIVKIDNDRCFRDLNDQDAQDEGFQTREELLQDLKQYYPQARGEDQITVIYFQLLDPAPNQV